jgi:NIMA (never in mitosis gene a)-related kinase
MEYADGGDIQAQIDKARASNASIDETAIVSWLAQAVLGLNYLHVSGVIHRDIKNANMFLTKSGTLKLGDFGVARQFTVTT